MDASPANGLPAPARETPRDRMLDDNELRRVIGAARQVGDPYAGILELLVLPGQRREEVAQLTWDEVDFEARTLTLAGSRTKNGRSHIVHLSDPAMAVLRRIPKLSEFIFSRSGVKPFQGFSAAKRELDKLSGIEGWRLHDLRRTCVSGMARLGVAPHVADKVLNHQFGTISGVAAVYQRHEFLAERKNALDRWGAHVAGLLKNEELLVA
jgi:integrase